MKYVSTYTLIAGSRACPYDCPICISKMTPSYGIGTGKPDVNWHMFEKATQIALNHNARNVLITGKGEPLMFPGQVSQYLIRLYQKPFDKREIQTNGNELANGGRIYDEFLDVWKDLGLDTIAVSIYHYDLQKNKEMFRPRRGEYFDLPGLIGKINSRGITTRLSCVMLEDYIDTPEEVERLMDFAKQNNVFQLTLRTADYPESPLDAKVAQYIRENRLSDEKLKVINEFIKREGTLTDILSHHAGVYELHGQNMCLTTGLTYDVGEDEIRQLIFFPQGWLTTSWVHVQGGRIL